MTQLLPTASLLTGLKPKPQEVCYYWNMVMVKFIFLKIDWEIVQYAQEVSASLETEFNL